VTELKNIEPQENAVIINHVRTRVEDNSVRSYIYTNDRNDALPLAEPSQNLFTLAVTAMVQRKKVKISTDNGIVMSIRADNWFN
jgi:2',3'-cyclic-nucleotide 2'-phosphodiesterase (5'-nucleotidase family)